MIKDGKLICPEARIENTSKCNANCTICPREKMTRPKVTMPNHVFFPLVDECLALGATTISIFGYGEPLVDEYFTDKVKYVNDKGLNSFTTTNASLLDTEVSFAILDAGLNDIRFSVHGFNSKDYEAVHKGLKWRTTLRNIANFIKVRSGKGYDCRVHVSCIPMNNQSVEDVKAFWEQFDIDHLEIWKPHDWAGGRDYRQINKRKLTCGRPFTGPIQINADGKMMVCCFDTDAKMTIGNTFRSSIRYILENSEQLAFVRHCHEVGFYGGLPCSTCDQLNIEDESPLLYSTRDPDCGTGKTSSTKFVLERE
jgi:hypothetical protein